MKVNITPILNTFNLFICSVKIYQVKGVLRYLPNRLKRLERVSKMVALLLQSILVFVNNCVRTVESICGFFLPLLCSYSQTHTHIHMLYLNLVIFLTVVLCNISYITIFLFPSLNIPDTTTHNLICNNNQINRTITAK